jgi:hypothetical protein
MRDVEALAKANWVRIDLAKRKLKNIGMGEPGEPIDPKIVYRVYGVDGNIWPRMTVSVSVDRWQGTVRIGAGIKTDNKAWWSDLRGVPYALLDDLAEMLQELREKLDGAQG